MAARPRRTERRKELRFAYWNAAGLRSMKLAFEHFLSHHGFDICLLNKTFLNPGQAFRLANYVCHRTDKPISWGSTDNLVHRVIDHHSVSIPDLTHLEATVIKITFEWRQVFTQRTNFVINNF